MPSTCNQLPSPSPLLACYLKSMICADFSCKLLNCRHLSHTLESQGVMGSAVGHCLRLIRCYTPKSGTRRPNRGPAAELSKSDSPPPWDEVRTRLPTGRRERPFPSITCSRALSRLRRYRVGNCTFVTSGRHGNQR